MRNRCVSIAIRASWHHCTQHRWGGCTVTSAITAPMNFSGCHVTCVALLPATDVRIIERTVAQSDCGITVSLLSAAISILSLCRHDYAYPASPRRIHQGNKFIWATFCSRQFPNQFIVIKKSPAVLSLKFCFLFNFASILVCINVNHQVMERYICPFFILSATSSLSLSLRQRRKNLSLEIAFERQQPKWFQ